MKIIFVTFQLKDTAVFMSKAATHYILHGMVFGT